MCRMLMDGAVSRGLHVTHHLPLFRHPFHLRNNNGFNNNNNTPDSLLARRKEEGEDDDEE